MEIDLKELIFAVINFLILMLILIKFGWKPITKTMDARKNEITDSLEKAAVAKKEAEATHAMLTGEIENARRQAREIVEEAQKAGEAVKNDIINQAQVAATAAMERAQEEIERKQAEAISLIKGEVANLVVLATSKLLVDNMSMEQHKALVDKYIAEVGDK